MLVAWARVMVGSWGWAGWERVKVKGESEQ